ncbi:hypothetical protein GCM10010913_14310 [Paenibacillus aceti]|uniref:Transmembrane protein n=1 Tax=Paenibacillus aceti TaxID=1820010 RepID=A0ABQ1VT18_9BACL|nr:hypothetical protein GCM10010913_14310 [Paenibacillus aceti]
MHLVHLKLHVTVERGKLEFLSVHFTTKLLVMRDVTHLAALFAVSFLLVSFLLVSFLLVPFSICT